MKPKKIVFVFGTRPEAIKMAPVINQLRNSPDKFKPLVVVTGQHRQMLDQCLRIFGIAPDYDLKIMEVKQSITSIVVKTLSGLDNILLQEKPDFLLVQGDTSTTFAAALEAFYHNIPVGHIEAGLRTFDKQHPYPEEINRQLTTSLAELHFPPTPSALENLLAERVPRQQICLTGNTVIDALLEVAQKEFDLLSAGVRLTPGKKAVLMTLHRRESLGEPQRQICLAVRELAEKFISEVEFFLPVHRNPLVSDVVGEVLSGLENVHLLDPLDYLPFVHLMKAAYLVITDSGGVQEEAPSFGKPVLVTREKTERPEAVIAGTVKLVGFDRERIVSEVSQLLISPAAYQAMSRAVNPYGDGQASQRIAAALENYFGWSKAPVEEFHA